MNSPIALVAVDVGNSAAKICVRTHTDSDDCASAPDTFHQSELPRLESVSFSVESDDWTHRAREWVSEYTHRALNGGGRPDEVIQWRIASVRSDASQDLITSLKGSPESSDVRVIDHSMVPIRDAVDHRERVGIDRLVGAFAAVRLGNSPTTVVDAGSAVTVDWVNQDACFCGGAIMPGLGLQLRSLARDTDALPEVSFEQDSPSSTFIRPATNTVDAIRLGVLSSVAAAIDHLAEQYAATVIAAQVLSGPNVVFCGDAAAGASVLLSGGDARRIAPYLKCRYQLVDNLVCRGLLDLPLDRTF